jgi:hypothetical protein
VLAILVCIVEPKKAMPIKAAATMMVQAKKVSKELVGKFCPP